MAKNRAQTILLAGALILGAFFAGMYSRNDGNEVQAQAGSNNWDYRWTGNFQVSYFHSTESMEEDETRWENVKTIGINENWLMVEQPAQGDRPKSMHLLARDNVRHFSFSDME